LVLGQRTPVRGAALHNGGQIGNGSCPVTHRSASFADDVRHNALEPVDITL
jgi:hypothetical protein